MTMDTRPRARPLAVALMGPTASGKSAYALDLAQRLGGEIVSVDSALVYRGLDIGAAKPTREEQAQVPHHLIDVRDPWQPYSAAEFAADARRAIDGIVARGRIPILAGGTGLYFRALLEGLADMPHADETVRADLAADADARGWAALHADLALVDAEAAARIHATDAQRIQRALEVHRLSGRAISDWQRDAQRTRLPLKVLKLALSPPDRGVLHGRIAARFDAMLEAGFLDEVRALRGLPELAAHPHPLDLPALRAVGYRQAWEFLDAIESPSPVGRGVGVRVLSGNQFHDIPNPHPALRATFSRGEEEKELRERAIAATRQLARRQFTWLRRELDARRFDPVTQRTQLDDAITGFIGNPAH